MALKVCLQWPTVGPYHAARIRAALKAADNQDIRIVVCETAAVDLTGMRQATIGMPVERVTVFDDQALRDRSPREVEDGMRRALDNMQPDVVAITGNSTPEARGCLAWCIDNRRGAILMTESREEDAPRSGWRETLKSIIVRAYDAALVAGTPHRAYARKLGMTDAEIFDGYSVVDNDYFTAEAELIRQNPRSAQDLPGLNSDTPYFLSVGRMIARKDFETLLAAYRTYASRNSEPWRLVIVGEGHLRPELEAYVSDHDLIGVTFAGNHPNSVMPAYYALAGALIHPARIDQWGLVVNEAMASGLPVIVSEGTGAGRDLVIDGKTGYRFETSNDSALAEKMDRIALDDELRRRMGESARIHVASWSVDRFGNSLVAAAKYAAARRKRRRTLGRLALKAIRLLAKDMSSFQIVEV